MRIAILAAGAGGMYCGSCLRDNLLASALMRAGHKVALVPMYTPLKTDEQSVAQKEVFYGGVNVWLQYASGVFRKTPRAVDWLFDRPWLLKIAGQYGAQTSPAKLGPFTLSILRGEEGPQVKELRRLVRFLKDDLGPQVITLPNTMFIGLAKMLGEELNVPVICELTGEDVFLDAMAEPYRSEALELTRRKAGDVTRFVATSAYYAGRMAEYLQVPREKISVVYPGVPLGQCHDGPSARASQGGPTVGYFARVCPEKGLDRLVDALPELLKRVPGAKIVAGGYLGAANQEWYGALHQRIETMGLAGSFQYAGETGLARKLELMDSFDVLSVPTAYQEPKGIYVLEALGRGVPVVQPRHGAFPELIEKTGGGILVEPGDPVALAKGLAEVLMDRRLRDELAAAGNRAVRENFTDEKMADRMVEVIDEAIELKNVGVPRHTLRG